MEYKEQLDALIKMVHRISTDIAIVNLNSDQKTKAKEGLTIINCVFNYNNMGDEINISSSQVGSIGKNNSVTQNNEFNQSNFTLSNGQFESLEVELKKLRDSLLCEAIDTGHYISIGDVAAAEHAAKQKNSSGVQKHLLAAGKWALDKAQTIGVPVIIELLKNQLKS